MRSLDLRPFPFALMLGIGLALLVFGIIMWIMRDAERTYDLRVARNGQVATATITSKTQRSSARGERGHHLDLVVTVGGLEQPAAVQTAVPVAMFESLSVGSTLEGRFLDGEFIPDDLIGDVAIPLGVPLLGTLLGVALIIASAYIPFWLVGRHYRLTRTAP